jgi:hypothetical protein
MVWSRLFPKYVCPCAFSVAGPHAAWCLSEHCPSGDNPATTADETDCQDKFKNGAVNVSSASGGGMPGNLCHVDCANRGGRGSGTFTPALCFTLGAAQAAAIIPQVYVDAMKDTTAKHASSSRCSQRTKAGESLSKMKFFVNKVPFNLPFDGYVGKPAAAP